MKRLNDKIVVITGASSGIGRASAVAFAKRKANIVLAARRVEMLEQVKAEVESYGVKALVVPTDVTVPDQVQRMVDASLEHFGQIDVVLNNAGYGLMGAAVETPIEEVRKLFDLNVYAAADVMHRVLSVMDRQGWGVIINVASLAGIFPTPYMPYYNASKAALVMLSESVNCEYLGERIHIVAFNPGMTETEFGQAEKRYGRFTKWIKPVGNVSAEYVAERIVKAALNPRPVVNIGWFVKPSMLIKDIFPGLFYWGMKKYRDKMREANLHG